MLIDLRRSSVGRKSLMAATGLILLLFVIGHLLGNLQIFLGPDALNAYALKLEHLKPLLWIARVVLLLAVLIHLWTSVQLSLENRRARPVGYQRQQMARTTLAARTMLLSGVLLLAYILYHLLHFTFRVAHPAVAHLVDAHGHRDVYGMVVRSFQQWPIAAVYVAAMACLCAHLSHGIGSAPQTLGLNDERTLAAFQRGGALLAGLLFLGYSAIPLAVMLRLVR